MARHRGVRDVHVATAIVAAATIVLCTVGLATGVFAGYRRQATDVLFPIGSADPRIVVVGIDARSINDTAQRWPWPRDVQAKLFDAIADAHPQATVIDIIFDQATSQDGALLAALTRLGAVVLAAQAKLAPSGESLVYRTATIASPVESVTPDAAVVASTAVRPDGVDGVVRSVPLALEDTDGNIVPSLSLAALAAVDKLPDVVTLRRPNGVQLGSRYVPTENKASLRVAFPDELSGLSNVVSAADVLAGKARQRLEGKIVFVGAADSTLGDNLRIPSDKGVGVPGVLVHASALSTMLTRSYIHPASTATTILVVAVLAGVISLVSARWRLRLSALTALALSAAYLFVGFIQFDRGQEVDFVYPLLAIVVAYGASLGARYLLEARERGRVAALLGQYVPADVARRLIERRGGLPTGTITFLFTDVVGSTEAWEAYPRQMGNAMRRHDELIERAVEGEGGALVRARGEGDSRFGVFLRPVDGARAALAIDRVVMGEKWETAEPIRVRMGLHTGEAELRDGDYYGAPVNRCARIRGVAGPGQIMLSETTAEAIGEELDDCKVIDCGHHSLKGIAEPEHIFELVSVKRQVLPSR